MDTAIKHPVSDRVKPSCVIFDIRALWCSTFTFRATLMLQTLCRPDEEKWRN